jgi:hypothetical protein
LVTLARLIEVWNTFFHASVSLYPLAVFRFCFGVLIAINAILLLPTVVKRHLAPDAILNLQRWELLYGRRRLTLLNLLPPTLSSVYLLVGLCFVAGICLSIGFFSRVSSIVCFVTLVSLHHRNPAIFHGGDTVMRLMSFLLIFAPSGNGWSIDAVMNERWEATGDPWCLRLMQIQVSIIYLRTVFWKLRGIQWRDGTAVWYVANCNAYRRFQIPRRLLTPFVVRPMTWSTLVIEFALGTCIWISELRWITMILGILLHLTIEVAMNLQLFSYVMIACLLLFL